MSDVTYPMPKEAQLDREITVRIGRIARGQGTVQDRQELQDLSIERGKIMERAGLPGYDRMRKLARGR